MEFAVVVFRAPKYPGFSIRIGLPASTSNWAHRNSACRVLLGSIGASLASAMADAKAREAALITFLAAAANIRLLGIGGAFRALVIGLLSYAVLNGRLPWQYRHGRPPGTCATAPTITKS